VSIEGVARRADAVEQLVAEGVQRLDLRDCLTGFRDLERLLAKTSVGQANPRDLGVLRDSLGRLPAWRELVAAGDDSALERLLGEQDLLEDLHAEMDRLLTDEPPADLNTGGAIRPGNDSKLDELVEMATSGRDFIARLEQQERSNTGISSLKIKFNRVFGYYIEVTKPNLHLVPEHYRRKQTTANAERYETDELKLKEDQILSAQENRLVLERTLVAELVERVRADGERILQVAKQVANSDVVAALAELASDQGYCRPQVDDSELIDIAEGRHPVVEQLMKTERFVPNDVKVDCNDQQLLIITGPNMAGKSTTIRQVALIAIMAQMGSFVPAASARIGLVDRIFTRIGAADNLARGQSTFMVEMIETAHILHHATRHSLLILDEIGRGTSTFDGLSIAWAVAEFVHDRVGARTLFATHYHQLSDLTLTKSRVANYTISVKEWNDQIIFLRRLVSGITNRSYGIQVGKLAGLPALVVERAKEVLANLEGQEFDEIGAPRLSRTAAVEGRSPGQLQLFGAPAPSPLDAELAELDLDGLSPLEALQLLHRWKGRLN
jgi:DNA mismatch repair protein MutS